MLTEGEQGASSFACGSVGMVEVRLRRVVGSVNVCQFYDLGALGCCFLLSLWHVLRAEDSSHWN